MTFTRKAQPLQKYNVSSKMLYRMGGDLVMPGEKAADGTLAADPAATNDPAATEPAATDDPAATEPVADESSATVNESPKAQEAAAANTGGIFGMMKKSAIDTANQFSQILAPKSVPQTDPVEGTNQEEEEKEEEKNEEEEEEKEPSGQSDFQLANKLTDLLSKKEDKETNLLEEILKGVTELKNKMMANDNSAAPPDVETPTDNNFNSENGTDNNFNSENGMENNFNSENGMENSMGLQSGAADSMGEASTGESAIASTGEEPTDSVGALGSAETVGALGSAETVGAPESMGSAESEPGTPESMGSAESMEPGAPNSMGSAESEEPGAPESMEPKGATPPKIGGKRTRRNRKRNRKSRKSCGKL